MIPENHYIVFFDVDGTLINGNSGTILVKSGYKNGVISTKNFIHALFLSLLFRFNLRKPGKIMDGMAAWLKGLSEDTVKKLSDEVFLSSLYPAIRPEVYAEIRFHKEHNARVVILSSAVQFVCLPLAKHLAMDDVICSQLEVSEGVFTGRFAGDLCYGNEKVNRLKIYCKEMNCSPEKAYYYADSISDFKALDSVGYPVCVNPDKKLAKVASGKHWIIHEWH
jgi:putative phosphoserine phosphatase / 1-acylglycerol-3-phosphate O-acyltransferase